MKKIQFFFLLLSSIIVFSACDKHEPDGQWDDIIKLSSKEGELAATTDSVTFTTEGNWWWVTEISINDSVYLPEESVNVEADSYTIQVQDVVVERRDAQELIVKAQENTSGEERIIKVGLQAGDYFSGVTVTQAPN